MQQETTSSSLSSTQPVANDENDLNTLVHRYLLQVQGQRLYPQRIPVYAMQNVLDIGCLAGNWIFDLAQEHPHLSICGIDNGEETLQQARTKRNEASLRQIEFRQVDFSQPTLPLPELAFNLVHARYCTRFILPQAWPNFLHECQRILKPGGWLVINELEMCELSSPACMTIQQLSLQIYNALGRTLDKSGLTVGVATRLYSMLLQASFDEVAYELYCLDFGFMAGPAMHLLLTQTIRQAAIIKPLLIQQGLLSNDEFDDLVTQANKELQAPDLCGWGILVSAYGKYTQQ